MRPCCCNKLPTSACVLPYTTTIYITYVDGSTISLEDLLNKINPGTSGLPAAWNSGGGQIFWERDKGVPREIELVFTKDDSYAYSSSLLWEQGQIPEDLELDILDASNTQPISIITSEKHGLRSSNEVIISGVEGNIAANNNEDRPTWRIEVVDDDTFNLIGSDGRITDTNGEYVWLTGTVTVEKPPPPTQKDVLFEFNLGNKVEYFTTELDWNDETQTLESTNLEVFDLNHTVYNPICPADRDEKEVFIPDIGFELAQDILNIETGGGYGWDVRNFSFKTKPDFNRFFSTSDMQSYSMKIRFGEDITRARFYEVKVAFKEDEEDDPKHSISIYSNTWQIGPTSTRDHRIQGGTLYAWDIPNDKGEQLLELIDNSDTPSGIPEVGEDSKSEWLTCLTLQPTTDSTALVFDNDDPFKMPDDPTEIGGSLALMDSKSAPIGVKLYDFPEEGFITTSVTGEPAEIDKKYFYKRTEPDLNQKVFMGAFAEATRSFVENPIFVIGGSEGASDAPTNVVTVPYTNPVGNWINGHDIKLDFTKRYIYLDPRYKRNIDNINQPTIQLRVGSVIVTSSSAHELVTGDRVRITEVDEPMDILNQEFTITVLSFNTFSLDGAPQVSHLDYSGGGKIQVYRQKTIDYTMEIGKQAFVSAECESIVAKCPNMALLGLEVNDPKETMMCDPVGDPVNISKVPLINSEGSTDPFSTGCYDPEPAIEPSKYDCVGENDSFFVEHNQGSFGKFDLVADTSGSTPAADVLAEECWDSYDEYKNDYLAKVNSVVENGYRAYGNKTTPSGITRRCLPKQAREYELHAMQATLDYDLNTWPHYTKPDEPDASMQVNCLHPPGGCIEDGEWKPEHKINFKCVGDVTLKSEIRPDCFWDFPQLANSEDKEGSTPKRYKNLEILTGQIFYLYPRKRYYAFEIQEYISQFPATYYKGYSYEAAKTGDCDELFGAPSDYKWEECKKVELIEKKIVDVSASPPDTPIAVATEEAHGFETGDEITISGVEGISGANGTFTITVLTDIDFELGDSSGNGFYDIENPTGTATKSTSNVEPRIRDIQWKETKPYTTKIEPDTSGFDFTTTVNTRWSAWDYKDKLVTGEHDCQITAESVNEGEIQDNICRQMEEVEHVIVDATNASPIGITTEEAHGLKTGDKVKIYGVLGNTAANNTESNTHWTITLVTSTEFDLDDSTGNADYEGLGTAVSEVDKTTIYTQNIWYKSMLAGDDAKYLPFYDARTIPSDSSVIYYFKTKFIEQKDLLQTARENEEEGIIYETLQWEQDLKLINVSKTIATAINSGYSEGELDVQSDTFDYYKNSMLQTTKSANIAGQKLLLMTPEEVIPEDGDIPIEDKKYKEKWSIHKGIMSEYKFEVDTIFDIKTRPPIKCPSDLDDMDCLVYEDIIVQGKRCLRNYSPCSFFGPKQIGDITVIPKESFSPYLSESECPPSIAASDPPNCCKTLREDKTEPCCTAERKAANQPIWSLQNPNSAIATINATHIDPYFSKSTLDTFMATVDEKNIEVTTNCGCDTYIEWGSRIDVVGTADGGCYRGTCRPKGSFVTADTNSFFFTTNIATATCEWKIPKNGTKGEEDIDVFPANTAVSGGCDAITVGFRGDVTICTDLVPCTNMPDREDIGNGPIQPGQIGGGLGDTDPIISGECIASGGTCKQCGTSKGHVITPLEELLLKGRLSQEVFQCFGKCRNGGLALCATTDLLKEECLTSCRNNLWRYLKVRIKETCKYIVSPFACLDNPIEGKFTTLDLIDKTTDRFEDTVSHEDKSLNTSTHTATTLKDILPEFIIAQEECE